MEIIGTKNLCLRKVNNLEKQLQSTLSQQVLAGVQIPSIG